MKVHTENTLLLATLLCFVSLLLSGCDNEFSPFSVGSEQETIVVNGFLNLNADTQFVRVQLVRREIELNASADDGLTADLLNLRDNSSETMTDSLHLLPSGKVVHLFYTTAPIEAETPYELRVDGRNGGESRNTTNIPKRGSFITESVENLGSTSVDPISQRIRLRGLREKPNNVTVTYTVLRNGTGAPIDFVFQYDDDVSVEPTGDSYTMRVNLELDRSNIIAALSLPQDDATTVLQNVALSYETLSIEWSLNRPETDFEFFASVATFDEPWILPVTVLAALRYAVP